MTLVASWYNIGETRRNVSLFQENGSFAIEESGRPRQLTDPYNYEEIPVDRALMMFSKTIQKNLNRETLHESCFFPAWIWQASNNSQVQVALFGYFDLLDSHPPQVKGMRWGLFDSSTGMQRSLEVDDPIAIRFLEEAPVTNIEKYAKRFSVVLQKDRNSNRIQRIAFRYVSLFDPNVFLDENSWAVTLVSSPKSTRYWDAVFGRAFRRNEFVGHAMIACEGVREEKPFLTYLDLIEKPLSEEPDGYRWICSRIFNQREGLIRERTAEGFTESIAHHKSGTTNGPTWPRSRSLVENMLHTVLQEMNTPVRFSFYDNCLGELCFLNGPRYGVACCSPWCVHCGYVTCGSCGAISCFCLMENLLESAERTQVQRLEPLINRRLEGHGPQTCLRWAGKAIAHSGIFLRVHNNFRTPLEMLEMINEIKNPPIYSYSDLSFNDHLLGRAELLTPPVVLSAPDESLEDLAHLKRLRNQKIAEWMRNDLKNILFFPFY